MILSRVGHPNVVLILLNPQTLILMPQEVTILSRVRHPNVVRFYGASITPPVFIVSELMHQDLGTLIHSRPSRLSLNEALGYGWIFSLAMYSDRYFSPCFGPNYRYECLKHKFCFALNGPNSHKTLSLEEA